MTSKELLEEQLEILAEHLGINSSEDIISTFIQQKVVKIDDTIVTYREYEDKTNYFLITPFSSRANDGESASLNAGPISRLADHGFIVKDVTAYDSVEPRGGKYSDEHKHHPSADKYITTKLRYVGMDHPIIEMYE